MTELSPVVKIASLLWECSEFRVLGYEMSNNIFGEFKMNHQEQMDRWIKCGQEYQYSRKSQQHKELIDKMCSYKENYYYRNIGLSGCSDYKQLLKLLQTLENSLNELDKCLLYSKELIASEDIPLDYIHVIHKNDINLVEKIVGKKINAYLKNNFSSEIINLLIKSPSSIKTLSTNEKLTYYQNTLCNINISKRWKLMNVKSAQLNELNESTLISNLHPDNLFDEIGGNIIMITTTNSSSFTRIKRRFEISNNVEQNISNILDIPKNSRYLITLNAYKKAMEDLKINRANSRECCICGEKLHFFERNLTCKKHRQHEDEL